MPQRWTDAEQRSVACALKKAFQQRPWSSNRILLEEAQSSLPRDRRVAFSPQLAAWVDRQVRTIGGTPLGIPEKVLAALLPTLSPVVLEVARTRSVELLGRIVAGILTKDEVRVAFQEVAGRVASRLDAEDEPQGRCARTRSVLLLGIPHRAGRSLQRRFARSLAISHWNEARPTVALLASMSCSDFVFVCEPLSARVERFLNAAGYGDAYRPDDTAKLRTTLAALALATTAGEQNRSSPPN